MKYRIIDHQGDMFSDRLFDSLEEVRSRLISFHQGDSDSPEHLAEFTLNEILDFGDWDYEAIPCPPTPEFYHDALRDDYNRIILTAHEEGVCDIEPYRVDSSSLSLAVNGRLYSYSDQANLNHDCDLLREAVYNFFSHVGKVSPTVNQEQLAIIDYAK